MKKVVLLGDSIRLDGYGKSVENALAGEYEVWQPADNCRYAKYTLRQLHDWESELMGADTVHWNNGIWDVCSCIDGDPVTPIEHYTEEIARIAKFLQRHAKTVIFATTTPVRKTNPTITNERIEAYNKAAVQRLQQMGVVINDLYSAVCADIPRYICEDNVHLTQEGIDLCAAQVENVIRRQAERL